MMDIDFLPPHLVIMGGSYIGLEFAQAYRRFGSEVTVIELGPRLISREEFNTGPYFATAADVFRFSNLLLAH